MLDVTRVSQDISAVEQMLKSRNNTFDVQILVRLNEERKAFIQQSQKIKEERKEISAQVHLAKKKGEDPQKAVERSKVLAEAEKQMDQKLE
jgi:seryl-tRNA synthetase